MQPLIELFSLNSASVLVVPDFGNASSDPRVAGLKTRCDDAKPLGLVRVDREENMVVYEGTRASHSIVNNNQN